MKFLKKMLSKRNTSSNGIGTQEQGFDKNIRKSSRTLDKENLDEVMNYALNQIELAKTHR